MTSDYDRSSKKLLAITLLALVGSLYLIAFIVPFTPIYQGDSVPIFLLDAVRMSQGQVIYRDFFELTLPGTQYVYLTMINLFGARAWIPNVMFVLVGSGLAWFGLAISKHILRGKLFLLPSIVFLAFAYTSEADPTHHWYSTLAVMAALTLLIEKRSANRLAGAGALCGLATLFTQSVGPAVALGLVAFLFWERTTKKQDWRELIKSLAALLGPLLATAVVPMAYLAFEAGPERFAYCTIAFPFAFFHFWYWNTFRVYLSEVPLSSSLLVEIPGIAIWLGMYILVPFAYFFLLARRAREAAHRPEEPWDRLMLLSLVGLFWFLSVSFSPSWLRICSVSYPAIIVAVWLLQSSRKSFLKFTNLLGGVAVVVLLSQGVIAQTDVEGDLNTPAGRIALLDSAQYEKFQWAQNHTQPGEYFFQASGSDIYYPLGLRDPARVPFLTASNYTRPAQVSDVIASLQENHVRFVLWGLWLDVPLHSPFVNSRLEPIRVYLRSHYHIVKGFGEPDYEQVWERNPEPSRIQ